MSELTTATFDQKKLRRQLLATASALSMLGWWHEAAATEGTDSHPSVWIELGGQLEHQNGDTFFTPPFLPDGKPDYASVSSIDVQKSPKYSYGGEAAISFEPAGSNWVFSASLRYSRSNGNKRVYEDDGGHLYANQRVLGSRGPVTTVAIDSALFTDTAARHDESHFVLDFQAERDVGLGLFGRQSSSNVNFGLRFAQFNMRSNIHIRTDPDQFITYVHPFPVLPSKYLAANHYHSYEGSLQSVRSFQGVGPSLSWESAALLAGNSENAELKLDWGINGAVLFGRQKAKIQHQTTAHFFDQKLPQTPAYGFSTPYRNAAHRTRSRSVVVPNVGGFVGLSVNYPNAKVKLGYRADIFFGAMDSGIDTRTTSDRSFYGPFAAISIGLP